MRERERERGVSHILLAQQQNSFFVTKGEKKIRKKRMKAKSQEEGWGEKAKKKS